MPSFPGVDFLDFDSLLSDEEKLARNTARQFVDAEIMPIIEEYNREGKFPVQLVPQMADLGLFGASLQGLRMRGHVQRGIRPGDAGAGARRFRTAQLRFGAIGAGDVSDSRVRFGRAKR